MKRAINEKGITLVALVITVVVLLILAGVAISTINETGIIAKSNDAAAKFNASQVNESENLIGYEDLIDKYGGADKIKFYIDGVEYYKKIEDNDFRWGYNIYRASDNKAVYVDSLYVDDRWILNGGELSGGELMIDDLFLRDNNGNLIYRGDNIVSNHNYKLESIELDFSERWPAS